MRHFRTSPPVSCGLEGYGSNSFHRRTMALVGRADTALLANSGVG